jgi:malonyl-CoA/methylmalonyl-CoA synthetase
VTSDNIYGLFERRFPVDRNTTFIETDDGATWSYADLERESARYAQQFAGLGVVEGDRIAVQVEKSPQAVFLYLACLRAGFVYVPLNTAYVEAELDYFFADAQPEVIVCAPAVQTVMSALAQRHGIRHVLTLGSDGDGSLIDSGMSPRFTTLDCAASDVAAILYTSGTTGRPKGAMITHGNLTANAQVLHRVWDWRPNDVLLHILPLFHVHGLFVACHCVLLNGTGMLFMRSFDRPTLRRLLPRATVLMAVPTIYVRLLADTEFDATDCRNMRLFISGSAPLHEQTFQDFRARTGHSILERYGMTETGMITSNPVAGPRVAGSVGLPLPGVSVRVVDDQNQVVGLNEVGHLQVKGANVFSGYWCRPEISAESFTRDGYFKTGDLARVDADGYLALVGRAKDLIITGGYNVYPKEVEAVIDALDSVVESAVIGLPHADYGEMVSAVVLRDRAGEDLTEASLIATLKRNLAGYKVPRRVFFVDALPRNTMGKVEKNVLRARYAALGSDNGAQ